LADSDCGSYKPVSELLPPVPWSELPVLSYGGGGEPAKIVCGYLHSSNTTVIPFLEEMPNFITFYFGDSARQTGLQAILDYMVQEAEEALPGAASLVFRAAELFFVEMIRRHADALNNRDQGWFGALHDPLMARALQLLHADPAYPWTVELLAQKAATSRSTLADRFKQRFGYGPMQYLSQWRIHLAAASLAQADVTISEAAAEVGFASESAFSPRAPVSCSPPRRRRRRCRGSPRTRPCPSDRSAAGRRSATPGRARAASAIAGAPA
ncbi:MAG: AraC family transcriptional regulator, partial [Pseudolabrys sp.]